MDSGLTARGGASTVWRRLRPMVAVLASLGMLLTTLGLVAPSASAAADSESDRGEPQVAAAEEKGPLEKFFGVVGFGWKAYKLADNCATNIKMSKSCFMSAEQRNFESLDGQLKALIAATEKNHADVMAVLDRIETNQLDEAIRREVASVRDDVAGLIPIATQKFQEYSCGLDYIDAVSDGKTPDACRITNENGNTDQKGTEKYGRPDSVEALFADGGNTMTGNEDGGLVARLAAATLGEWAAADHSMEVSDLRKSLRSKARDLTHAIAGTNLRFTPGNGILDASLARQAHEINKKQGRGPTAEGLLSFVGSSDMKRMNIVADYWIGQETLWYTTMIAALQLTNGGTEENPNTVAVALEDMAERGWGNNGEGLAQQEARSIEGQVRAFSIPDSEVIETRSWAVDGSQLYQLDNTNSDQGDVPKFETLQKVRKSLDDDRIFMSTLRANYPGAFPPDAPGSTSPIWMAHIGTDVQVLRIAQFSRKILRPVQDWYYLREYIIPRRGGGAESLDPIKPNQRLAEESVPCHAPVFMMDQLQPPSYDELTLKLLKPGAREGKVVPTHDPKSLPIGYNLFYRVPAEDGVASGLNPVRAPRETYKREVPNGVVPIYNLSIGQRSDSEESAGVFGVGSLPRCNGSENLRLTRPYGGKATVVEVKQIDPTGIWSRIATVPKAAVKAKAVDQHSKLRVRVDPDLLKGRYTVRVQKKAACRSDEGRCWRTKRVLQTRAVTHARTINLPRGRYRGVLPAGQNGLPRAVSKVVTLKR